MTPSPACSQDSLPTLRRCGKKQKTWSILKMGLLVLDDNTLDKPYAKSIELVTRHWSGRHHRVVLGINLISLIWTDGRAIIPTDFRVYDKPIGGKNKNEHFRDMLGAAKARGFEPNYVLFDSWYSSLDNLKLVNTYDWLWLTRLKSNRQVNPDGSGNVAVSTLEIGPAGKQLHLKGYGFIKVFRTVSPNGDAQYWATNELDMTMVTGYSLRILASSGPPKTKYGGVKPVRCSSAMRSTNRRFSCIATIIPGISC